MSPEAAQRKREKAKAWYHANREQDLERQRAMRATPGYRVKKKARAKAWYKLNAAKIKAGNRNARYGLAPGEFDAMLAAQAGLCAICKTYMKPPHVDHDHATARVRALLCTKCNVGLGMFKESMDRLFAASEYLRYWKVRYEN